MIVYEYVTHCLRKFHFCWSDKISLVPGDCDHQFYARFQWSAPWSFCWLPQWNPHTHASPKKHNNSWSCAPNITTWAEKIMFDHSSKILQIIKGGCEILHHLGWLRLVETPKKSWEVDHRFQLVIRSSQPSTATAPGSIIIAARAGNGPPNSRGPQVSWLWHLWRQKISKLLSVGLWKQLLKGVSEVFWYFFVHHLLVGGWATPLKNMKVNWDDDSQYMGK